MFAVLIDFLLSIQIYEFTFLVTAWALFHGEYNGVLYSLAYASSIPIIIPSALFVLCASSGLYFYWRAKTMQLEGPVFRMIYANAGAQILMVIASAGGITSAALKKASVLCSGSSGTALTCRFSTTFDWLANSSYAVLLLAWLVHIALASILINVTLYVSAFASLCASERERERERESVCVCVCV